MIQQFAGDAFPSERHHAGARTFSSGRDEIDRTAVAARPSQLEGWAGRRWLMLAAEMAGLANGSGRPAPDPVPAGRVSLPRIATRRLSADAGSVRAARDFTIVTLHRWGMAEPSQDIAIVVSELLTNAVRHALPGSGQTRLRRPIRLGLLQPGPYVLCAVADPSNAAPAPQMPGSLAETGRGLHIICALSDQWGYGPSDTGKVVWAMFYPRLTVYGWCTQPQYCSRYGNIARARPAKLRFRRGKRQAAEMTTNSRRGARATGLTDRRQERGVFDRLVDAVRAGESRVLVVRGDPGVGKTVLLAYLVSRASRCRIARAVGIQSEMELAFAGLHQLCAPVLDHLEAIPVPQREALRTALGLAAGPPPDRFLVGLAVLSLLSEVAGEQPLICVIDDEQWLDHASAQALGFVARRLAADPVGLVFAARVPGEELAGLPELALEGLGEGDARELLDSALAGPLDERVRDRIVAETQGNPLALLELPRGLTPAELAGGFGLPSAVPLAGRIEQSFLRQLDALPAETRRLLQLAAADPSGDPVLVRRAAERLGIPVQAETPAAEAGLVEFGVLVRFRHPLLRSAAYRSASAADRQAMHGALAEVTDPAVEPDRRAWHRAHATAGPDEEVAAELERSAGRAQARGGLAAAGAFLERSMLLTVDPARRAERTLAAAQANLQAGAFDKALELLVTMEVGGSGPLDELTSARMDLLRGQIAFAGSGGRQRGMGR